MTLTYGFYNSSAGDRVYDAIQMGRIFDGILVDGVYASIGNTFEVTPYVLMSVHVGTGRAWFNHTWSYNDAAITIAVATADPLLPRIDIVYLEVNEGTGVRANKVDIIAGTPASNPVPPTLTNNATVHQYPLAHINVSAGATSIGAQDIIQDVGTPATPYVVSGVYSPIAPGTVGPTELASDAVISGKIAAGAISEPDLFAVGVVDAAAVANGSIGLNELANDSVDDTKAGDRVPQVIRRKGGSSTNWNSVGTTSYTPGAVRIQVGAVQVVSPSTAVTFPVAFSAIPLVFPISTVSGGFAYPSSITASGFTANLTGGVSGPVYWLAIGPE